MIDQWQNLFDSARRENGLGNSERAEVLVRLAIVEAELLPPDSQSFASAQGSFALWAYHHDRFAEAEYYQSRYILTLQRIGISDRELAQQLMWLAEMQLRQIKLDTAKGTIENAIRQYHAGDWIELSQAYDDLASVCEELTDHTAALNAKRNSAEYRQKWDELVRCRKSAQFP